MLGREKEELEDIETAPRGEAVLRVEGWRSDAIPEVRDVTFEVARGEVVSLFGVRGCGADTVADGLAGRGGRIDGRVEIAGRQEAIFPNPRAARRANLGFVPAERKRDGLVLGQSIEANVSILVIGGLSRAGFVRGRERRRLAEQAMEDFDIRARDIGQPVGTLSGGNQQKVLLASRLAPDPTILVLHEPTRGVDIGARIEIHRLLRKLAAAGKALLVITTDVEEAVAVADRLLVMREGRLVDEMVGSERSQSRALRSAVGGGA
jgi:ABC-type sugar transport system ATPase subunit